MSGQGNEEPERLFRSETALEEEADVEVHPLSVADSLEVARDVFEDVVQMFAVELGLGEGTVHIQLHLVETGLLFFRLRFNILLEEIGFIDRVRKQNQTLPHGPFERSEEIGGVAGICRRV